MSATFANGKYGQVEANRLTGITFGDIEAQAPAYQEAAATNKIAELENGMFLCVIGEPTAGISPLGRIAVLPGAAPATARPMLVYSERKQYDERETYGDFVDKASDKVDGTLYPRLIGLTPDVCVFTTNCIKAAAGSLALGDTLYIGNDGYLYKGAKATNTVYEFKIIKVYTMPDGSPGVKVLCKTQV